MISNNIEELNEHLSLSVKDIDKQVGNLEILCCANGLNDVSLSQYCAFICKYIEYIETIASIMLAQIESCIESGELLDENGNVYFEDLGIDDKIKGEDILKVIKNNRTELCNRLCEFVYEKLITVCKIKINNAYNETETIDEMKDEMKTICDGSNLKNLNTEMPYEIVKAVYEFAKREEK